MNLYEKNKLLEKTRNMSQFILFRVHHNELTEEQGEQLLDDLIVKFNRKLLELERNETQ